MVMCLPARLRERRIFKMRTVIAIIFLVGVCMFSILKVGSDSDDRSGLGD